MMMIRILASMLFASRLLVGSQGQGDAVYSLDSTTVTVQYEYQLEVNDSQVNSPSSSAQELGEATSTQQVLDLIDSNILETLQMMLPEGGMTVSNPTVPNVEFTDVESEIYSACFTNNDHCSLVRTTLNVTYQGVKPEDSVETVTYGLVQDYLESITDNSNGKIIVTYLYPFLVTSLAQFQLETVDRRMGATEISVMEQSFLEVIGATVAAIEGDTEITDIKFIYQDLLPYNDNNTTLDRYVLSANFKVKGICRECSHTEFGGVVNAVIGANLNAYESQLKVNGELAGTPYFRSVNAVTFAVPKLPEDLPPIEDESIYDTLTPETRNALPVMLFSFGFTVAIVILAGGAFFIYKELREGENEKDVLSTESESDMGEYSVDMDSETGYAVEEYDIMSSSDDDDTNAMIDQSKKALDEYQVETVLSMEDLGGDNNDNQLIRSITQTYARPQSQRQHRSSKGYVDPAGRVYHSNGNSTPRSKSAMAGYETHAWLVER